MTERLVEIRLETGDGPLAGTFTAAGSPPERFSSWLDFLTLLERSRRPPEDDPATPDRSPAPAGDDTEGASS
jgi:hypothetical protein